MRTRGTTPRLAAAGARRPTSAEGEFLRALSERRLRHAVLRGASAFEPRTGPVWSLVAPGGAHTALTVLIDPDDLESVPTLARAHRLAVAPSPHRAGRTHLLRAPTGGRVEVVTRILYGRRVAWLATGECESRILRRATEVDRVRVAALPDRFVDAVLHALLDLGALSVEGRRDVSGLMARLRADPPAAGRAAERVQQELAPALPWGDLLAYVVDEQWDALLRRAGRVELRLWRGSPLASVGRLLTTGP